MEYKSHTIMKILDTAIVMSGTASTLDLFGAFGNSDDNITLIKNETSGRAFWTMDGKAYYSYDINGVFKNLPSNLEGYDLKVNFYDKNGTFLHEGGRDIEDVASDSQNNEVTYIGTFGAYKSYDIKKIEVIIEDAEGKIVFNETYEFDMDKMDLTSLDHEPTTTSNSSSDSISSSSSSDNANFNYDIDTNGKSAHYSVEGEVNGKSYNYDVNYNYN